MKKQKKKKKKKKKKKITISNMGSVPDRPVLDLHTPEGRKAELTLLARISHV